MEAIQFVSFVVVVVMAERKHIRDDRQYTKQQPSKKHLGELYSNRARISDASDSEISQRRWLRQEEKVSP